jgi:hypothetical protein
LSVIDQCNNILTYTIDIDIGIQYDQGCDS